MVGAPVTPTACAMTDLVAAAGLPMTGDDVR